LLFAATVHAKGQKYEWKCEKQAQMGFQFTEFCMYQTFYVFWAFLFANNVNVYKKTEQAISYSILTLNICSLVRQYNTFTS
jgi:hypothetical protein